MKNHPWGNNVCITSFSMQIHSALGIELQRGVSRLYIQANDSTLLFLLFERSYRTISSLFYNPLPAIVKQDWAIKPKRVSALSHAHKPFIVISATIWIFVENGVGWEGNP